MRTLSLYIHIPFCTRRCSYCSFFHVQSIEPNQLAFVEAFELELAAAVDDLGGAVQFSTVFMGGGTPSVLREDLLDRVFAAIAPFRNPSVTTEVTVELNPEDVTDRLLTFFSDRDVNRVSVGVQSMSAVAQEVLGRCSPETNRDALSLVMGSFDNVSFDLLLGVPGRPMDHLRSTLDELIALQPAHFSVYCLEPGGDMERAVTKFFDSVDAESAVEEYDFVCKRLSDLGYRHYEVSNFALPGRESAHNQAYWTGRDYLGVGPGAHSYIDGRRFSNAPSLRDYFDATGPARVQARIYDEVSAEESAMERMMLALRTDEGMPLAWCACGRDTIDELRREGLADVDDDKIRLTDRGFLMTNEILFRLSAT